MAQTVLITGSSAGIGKLTAERLARAGYRVFGASLNPDVPVAGITSLYMDVTNPDSIREGVQQVIQQAGQIDILINNAGIMGAMGGVDEISRRQWERVIDTNLLGPIELTRAVVPQMRARRSGFIINVSSVMGVMALPYYFTPYVTSKHALEGFTETLRGDLKPFGIRVALVEPSAMNTHLELSIDAPDAPHADYGVYRERMKAMMRYSIEHGRDPEIAAQAIEDLLRDADPPLRTPAGKDAKMIVGVARPLPHRPVETIMHWLFLQPMPWQPEREPVRRMMMDSEYSDAVQAKIGWAMAIIGPLVVLVGLLRRRR